MLERLKDERLRVLPVPLQVPSHLVDELTGRIRTRGEHVSNLLRRHVTDAKVILVDERIIDPIDVHLLKFGVIDSYLPTVMLKPKAFEEILVHDDRTSR